MKVVLMAASIVVGGVLTLASSPALATAASKDPGSVERTVTPRSCAVSYSPFIQRDVTQCHEGWSVVRTSGGPRDRQVVQTRSRSTTTAEATEPPAYSFKDVDDIWDKKIYEAGSLLFERQTIQVTYTIQGSDCVRRWTGVTRDGQTTTVEWSDTCPASAAPAAKAFRQ